MAIFDDIKAAVVEGARQRAKDLTEVALAQGADPLQIFQQALIPGMDIVGQGMRSGELYLPEVISAAKAMKGAAELLQPLIAQTESSRPKGKVVVGTVRGDMHDIGKNLVIMLLEGGGFQVVDLGIDVSGENFAKAVIKEKPQIVAMSALLTATMVRMRAVIDNLEEAGVRSKVRVMVGGAPLTQRFADEIGADGYSSDAAGAVELAKTWCSEVVKF